MRVKDSSPAYNMGKSKNKKHRLRKAKDAEIGASDSSDDGQGTLSGCPHINKAVNYAAMRKAILKAPYGQCVGCSRDGGAAAAAPCEAVGGAVGGEGDADSEATVWVCLQCGNQGCDRNSKEKHALKHFETPHSGAHCIVLNLSTWLVWCYSCDAFIPIANSRRIQECGEFLRNKAGLPKLDLSQPSTPAGASRRPPTPAKTEAGAGEHHQAAVRDNRTSNHKAPACHKVKGLSNLGNTCFFNAVMQNLSQTPGLEGMLLERTKKNICGTLPGKTAALEDSDTEEDEAEDLPPVEISLGEPGPLTSSLLAFLREMNNTSSRNATVNPDSVFRLICKKAPRFKGYQQQDSHELLHYLLDVVKSEEVKRGQSGILKLFKVPENLNPKKVDEDVRLKVKEYGKQVKHTFLDSLMGGCLVSTVMCEECKHISQVFEGFLDLSLPVTEEKPFRPSQGRRRETGEGEELAGGDPVVAHLPARPSKHSDKRNRRAAKKAAKRRAKVIDQQDAFLGGQSLFPSKEEGQRAEEGLPEEEEEEEEVEGGNADSSRKEEADGNESNSSHREDPSDADVEDNLESENSRLGGSDLHRDAQPASCPPVPTVCQTSENGGSPSVADSGIAASLDSSNSCSLASLDQPRKEGASDAAVLTNGNGHAEDGKAALEDSGVSSGQNGVCGLAVTEQCQSLAEQMEELNLADSRSNGADAGTSMSVEVTVMLPANGFQEVNGDASVPMEVEKMEEQAGEGKEAGAVEHAASAEDANNCSSQTSPSTAGQQQPSNGGPATAEAAATATRPGSSRKVELRREAQVRSLSTLAPRYQPTNMECSVRTCLNQFTSAELLTGPNRVICPECTRLHQHKEGGEKVYSNASKQYLLFSLPPVLTLHLKRFENVGLAARKVNRQVEFPLLLDMAPYCSALCQDARPGQTRIMYSLYGVVEHTGKLSSGHYMAYVKVRSNLGLTQSFLRRAPQQPEDYVQHYVEQVLNKQTPGAGLEHTLLEDTLETLVPPGRWYQVSDTRVSEISEHEMLQKQAYMLFYERIY